MRSKTSCFNGPVFRKNMTRFAPLWVLYTLCLLLGMTLMYMEDGEFFWFANRMGEAIQWSSLINLLYAPVVAMLLFGDLYNSRMCNALHAMPLRRGCWFTTHVVSGIFYSLIPTAIFCGLSIPLLMQTCVVDGWQIALWTFLGMNLTYLCFFGIAVFSVMLVGNRFGMIAMYALLNGGAFVAWFLVDTIYTPMLYGIITPTALSEALTPIFNLMEAVCLDLDNYNEVYRGTWDGAIVHYHLHNNGWQTLVIWALAGVAFLLIARWLYKKRRLECAGNTIAFKAMEPVFQICISLCSAAFFSIFIDLFIGYVFRNNWQYLFLGTGLVVGWFAGRMLLERTLRVFRVKNFLGFAALAAVLAASLAMTHYDVLGIETYMPDAEDVQSITFGYSGYRGMSEELTEDADIEAVLRLQALALQDRLTEGGTLIFLDGKPVSRAEVMASGLEKQAQYRYASNMYIYYTLENGRQVSRNYIVWGDGETGDIVNEYLSRWLVVSNECYYTEAIMTTATGEERPAAYTVINIAGYDAPEKYRGEKSVESLLEAIQADCEARNMTQNAAFHSGHFTYVNENGVAVNVRSMWIELSHDNGKSGSFNIYPDSENTLVWLAERDLLPYEVHAENSYNG